MLYQFSPIAISRNFTLLIILLLLRIHGSSQALPAQQAVQVDSPSIITAQDDKKLIQLELALPIKGELVGKQTHFYQIALSGKQYLRLVVKQLLIDVEIAIIGPDGIEVAKADSPNYLYGPEHISLIVHHSGKYRLEVRSNDPNAKIGKYEVSIKELRSAKLEDLNYVNAEKVFAEAVQEGDPTKAIDKYEGALELFRTVGDRQREADTLYYLGGVYQSLGRADGKQMQKALDLMKQALVLYRASEDSLGIANSLGTISRIYIDYGSKEQQQGSLKDLQEVLGLYKLVGNRYGEAQALQVIALGHFRLGDKQVAYHYYDQSLRIFKEVGALSDEAITLNNWGVAYHSEGRMEEALAVFNQAVPIYRKLGNSRELANTLSVIGATYGFLGEKQREINSLTEARQLQHPDQSVTANILTNIGQHYADLGGLQMSLEFYKEAFNIYEKSNDRLWQAILRGKMGIIYLRLNNTSEALSEFKKALALAQDIDSSEQIAAAFYGLGLTSYKEGDEQKALEYFNQALPRLQAEGNRPQEANTLISIGSIYANTGDQKALDYLNQGLKMVKDLKWPQNEAIALFDLAIFESKTGELTKALSTSEKALEIIESQRTKMISQDLRVSYFASAQQHYDFHINLLMQLHKKHPKEGYNAKALRISEQARARSLIELLAEARIDIRQGVAEELIALERNLQRQIATKAEIRTLLKSNKLKEGQAAKLDIEIDRLTAELHQNLAEIKQKSPNYAALTQPKAIGLADIQEQLLDNDSILLEYSLGKEQSYLWAVTPNTMNVYKLRPGVDIEKQARTVYDLLIARTKKNEKEDAESAFKRIQQADKDFQVEASRLSGMILGPVSSQLGKKRLLIVADGLLQYIPFAALPAPAMKSPYSSKTKLTKSISPRLIPLIVDHEVISLPSATTLAVLRQQFSDRKQAPKTIAILADPVFEKTDTRVTSTTQTQTIDKVDLGVSLYSEALRAWRDVRGDDAPTFERLKWTGEEAKAIIAGMPQDSLKLSLNFEANRDTATSKELGDYRIVHFATHGLLDDKHPEWSGVILSLVNENGKDQNGFLWLQDIYNLKLSADLVVLSACETALGAQIKGEGIIGLTRGFMYAGVPRVVATLWKVGDLPSSEMMKRFYAGMLGTKKLSPAAALRQAQLSLWKNKNWQFPYYWAAYILQGEYK